MDRVASWYKKHTQRAVVVIAVVVATGVNADTLHMAACLSTNETVRKATADDCGDHAVLPRSTLRPTLSVLVEAYGNQIKASLSDGTQGPSRRPPSTRHTPGFGPLSSLGSS
jgi:hypothetical protein